MCKMLIMSLTVSTSVRLILLGENRSTQSVLKEASVLIAKKYDIHHTTIQVERFHEQMDNCSLCKEPND